MCYIDNINQKLCIILIISTKYRYLPPSIAIRSVTNKAAAATHSALHSCSLPLLSTLSLRAPESHRNSALTLAAALCSC